MSYIESDDGYIKIVSSILYNEKFNKLKLIEHHGFNRMDHSIRVSYYSYKISKFLRLNYISTAKAGLLHDYFMSSMDRSKLEKLSSTFSHPKKALENSMKDYELTDMEKNIIRAHMFPINYVIPKYAESWIVSTVDKVVAIYEFSNKFSLKFSYAFNLLLIFIINIGK